MPQKPEISYSHVLSELSVNSKDPCEIIRELMSNSYDASASSIQIYPLLQYGGFIFFDNGIGLDGKDESKNGITPYRAFFSIGRSTKIMGDSIGYKCQGSKLCFASNKFALITRCAGETEYRTFSIDNPKAKLSPDCDIEPILETDPQKFLRSIFYLPDNRTEIILQKLDESFFTNNFKQGTMLIIQGYQCEDFSKYYSLDAQYPYIMSYIRFCTRHGDIRILKPRDTGFTAQADTNFRKINGYRDSTTLEIWCTNDEKLKFVEIGYPYLPKSGDQALKTPKDLSSLKDGRFYGRHAKTFSFEGNTYCITLAIDGYRKALEEYKELDRQRSARSGMKFFEQRGVFVCSHGVKICRFNELFNSPSLYDYKILSETEAQIHFTLMVNGNFALVTDRNSLTDAAVKTLKNEVFLKEINNFLNEAKKSLQVFSELIVRLSRDSEQFKIDEYLSTLDQIKGEIKNRERFQVRDIAHLNGRWIVSPSFGEEHWVGALYAMFSYLVPKDSPYSDIWLMPINFMGRNIDSLAIKLTESSLDQNVFKTVEYKYKFSHLEIYNHPLIATDNIVCWELEKDWKAEVTVEDSYEYFGKVKTVDKLEGIGYEISNLQSRNGEINNGYVWVICLKDLIAKTFNVSWTTPPTTTSTSPKKRRSK